MKRRIFERIRRQHRMLADLEAKAVPGTPPAVLAGIRNARFHIASAERIARQSRTTTTKGRS